MLRNIILTFSLVVIVKPAISQFEKTQITTTTLVEQRSIYLNGGVRSSVGGKSRVVVPIPELPSNTKEWYYSFYTSEGTSGIANLNLAVQLSSYLVDQTGITSNLLGKVKVPNGSASIDVYLLRYDNIKAFEEKWDLSGGTFSYFPDGSVKNTSQAAVKVSNANKGQWYLGILNPSSLNGINITVEVTAIVENIIYVDEWTTENKNKFITYCLEGFKTESNGKSIVCNCVLEKMLEHNTPSTWDKLTSNEQEVLFNSIKDNCFIETGNIKLKNDENLYQKQINYKSLIEQADQMQNGGNLEEAVKLYSEASILFPEDSYPKNQIDKLNRVIAQIKADNAVLKSKIDKINAIYNESNAAANLGEYTEAIAKIDSCLKLILIDKKLIDALGSSVIAKLYNSAAWYAILINNLNWASVYLKKGLSYDDGNMYLRGNLGLFHLLKGNYSEAEKAFLYYKRKERLPNGDKWVDVIESDLNLLEKKGMANSDFNRIRVLLKIK